MPVQMGPNGGTFWGHRYAVFTTYPNHSFTRSPPYPIVILFLIGRPDRFAKG